MVLDRPMDDLTDDFFAVRGTRDDLVWLPDVLIGVRRTATNVTAIVAADQTACRPACWSKRPAWTTSPRLSPFPWKESTDDRPRLHCVGCPLAASPHGVAVYPLASWRAGIDPWAGLPEAALGVVCGTAWLVALQAPVCFRFGYTTSRFVMIIVVLLVVCAVMGLASILQFSAAMQSAVPGWGVLVLAGVTAIGLWISHALSMRWYRRREL